MNEHVDTDHLVRMAAAGDQPARTALLVRHRVRLRRMVSARLDRRLKARIDPSDVVQETLVEATRRLPQYLNNRPMPYYAWLQLLAMQKLADLHRRHVQAARRSVRREEPGLAGLSGASAVRLAARLAGSVSSPGRAILHEELQSLLQAALARLGRREQQVLRLRISSSSRPPRPPP